MGRIWNQSQPFSRESLFTHNIEFDKVNGHHHPRFNDDEHDADEVEDGKVDL